ncbi:MAG: dihydroneopterin aldolase [Verrucomicrobiota bacterium]
MDKIYLKDLNFYGYHGVLAIEKETGQTFVVDIVLSLDLQPSGQSDDLEKTVNYAEVFVVARDIVEKDRYDLIETVAERISSKVLENFPLVQSIQVTIKKPNAPIPGKFDHVGVEIERSR